MISDMQEKPKPRGNPNPSPETRFGNGQPINLGGKTSNQRHAEYEAAEMAAIVSADLVRAVAGVMKSAGTDLDKLDLLKSDTLRLLKDVQDRAHGTPKSSVDLSSEDGSMSPKGLSEFYKAVPEPE